MGGRKPRWALDGQPHLTASWREIQVLGFLHRPLAAGVVAWLVRIEGSPSVSFECRRALAACLGRPLNSTMFDGIQYMLHFKIKSTLLIHPCGRRPQRACRTLCSCCASPQGTRLCAASAPRLDISHIDVSDETKYGTARDALGMTSSRVRGIRLNGSLVSDNRCDLIVDRSTIVRDEGSVTGSRMRVYMSGSAQNNGLDSGAGTESLE